MTTTLTTPTREQIADLLLDLITARRDRVEARNGDDATYAVGKATGLYLAVERLQPGIGNQLHDAAELAARRLGGTSFAQPHELLRPRLLAVLQEVGL